MKELAWETSQDRYKTMLYKRLDEYLTDKRYTIMNDKDCCLVYEDRGDYLQLEAGYSKNPRGMARIWKKLLTNKKDMHLSTFAIENEKLIKFYKRQGFEELSNDGYYIHMRRKTWPQ